MNHDDLVERARRWLCKDHAVVITEMSSGLGEEADVIGWKYGCSTLIECKASMSDFNRDKAKYFRMRPEQGLGFYRYYFSPAGLINPEILMEGWGLLEVRGKRVYKVRASVGFTERNRRGETTLLISALRRPDGLSVRKYTYQTKCRATVGVADESEGS